MLKMVIKIKKKPLQGALDELSIPLEKNFSHSSQRRNTHQN
jgi:hypothetical protein